MVRGLRHFLHLGTYTVVVVVVLVSVTDTTSLTTSFSVISMWIKNTKTLFKFCYFCILFIWNHLLLLLLHEFRNGCSRRGPLSEEIGLVIRAFTLIHEAAISKPKRKK